VLPRSAPPSPRPIEAFFPKQWFKVKGGKISNLLDSFFGPSYDGLVKSPIMIFSIIPWEPEPNLFYSFTDFGFPIAGE
jgi:hypothetical protein